MIWGIKVWGCGRILLNLHCEPAGMEFASDLLVFELLYKK